MRLRRRALAARVVADDVFHRLVDAVTDYAIYLVDPEGRVVTWNTGAERIKGWKAPEILGRSFSIFFPPEDVAAGKPVHELSMAARTGRFEEEGWRVRKDGTRFWASVTVTPIRQGEHLLGFSKVTRDLTEQRRLQEMQAMVRVKDEFLATVSHELRTPIHALVGWLDILGDSRTDEAARARALEAVKRNAKAQARIIEDLLDVSRMTSGRLRVAFEKVDLAEAVADAVDVVRPGADARGVAISVDARSAMVSGDRDRLVQVVWNLLSNAVKFTPTGGRVTVRTRTTDDTVVATVRDTGRGIAPEFLPFVFDRFRQADATSTRTVGGLGIGLTIARHLVELHGGTLEAESPGEGKGATFRVRLPRYARDRTSRKRS